MSASYIEKEVKPMRKTVMTLCLLLCLTLCACGTPAGAEKAPYDGDDVAALLDAGLFSEAPEELDDDIACELLGVDSALVSDCQVYLPTSTNGEALALLVLSSAEDAQTAQSACEAWIADQIDSYRDYSPTNVPKLEGAVISVRENTVLLVVGSDPAAAQAAVDGLE